MFDIGQRVVCVDDKFPIGIHDIYNALPKAGRVYRVRDIVPAQDFKLQGTCAVLIEELINKPNRHGIEPGFQTYRFREMTPLEEAQHAENKEPCTL